MKTKQCQRCKTHQGVWLWGEPLELMTHMEITLEMYDKGWPGDIPVKCPSCGYEFTSYQWKHIPTQDRRES